MCFNAKTSPRAVVRQFHSGDKTSPNATAHRRRQSQSQVTTVATTAVENLLLQVEFATLMFIDNLRRNHFKQFCDIVHRHMCMMPRSLFPIKVTSVPPRFPPSSAYMRRMFICPASRETYIAHREALPTFSKYVLQIVLAMGASVPV